MNYNLPRMQQITQNRNRLTPNKPRLLKKGLKNPMFTATQGASFGSGGRDQNQTSPSAPLWNSQYETQVGALNKNYADQMANFTNQENTTRSTYGFDPQYANDPYSRANLLKDSWNTNRRAVSTGGAARGQLYSGSTSNALRYADEGYGKAYDTTQKEYQGALNQLQQGRLGAEGELRTGIAAAEAQRIQQMLDDARQLDTSDLPGETLAQKAAKRHKKNKKGKK